MRGISALGVCGVLAAAPIASAGSVSIGASKDNTLYESSKGELSNGAGMHFFAGNTLGAERRRGLLAFDVASAIPAGSTIDSVTLTLHMSRSISGAQDVSLHPVAMDWGESFSDAAGQEGGGVFAELGDATWTESILGTSSWSTIGGDFGPLSASTPVAGEGHYNWSSAAMALDVQSWLDDPGNNFGWLLLGNEATAATAKRFDTRENPIAEFRPELSVEFTIPAPGALAVLGLGGLVATRRRR